MVFVTCEPALLAAGQHEVTVRMHHCEPVEAELLGVGTGQPGQVLRAGRAPLARTAEPLDLLLGVEVPAGSVELGAAAREHDGRTFEIWRAVDSFAGLGPQDKAYLVDRCSGTVTFAPALDLRAADGGTLTFGDGAVAAVPPAGRQVRLWYRAGGGPAGNVAAGTLTNLRDPLPGVKVVNPLPAAGGREIEAMESVLLRGPYAFFAQQRAVTARDFEVLATASGGVTRARAFTRAAVYSFARPGEVEVVLVPYVPDEARPGGRLPVTVLRDHEVEEVRLRVEADLERRRSLGTTCRATWARYKAVSIRARVVVRREEDVDAVRRRIHDRLHQTLSPLPTTLNPTGWAFGEPLRASNVYRLLEHAEPGCVTSSRCGSRSTRHRTSRCVPSRPTSTSPAPGTPAAGRCCSAPRTRGPVGSRRAASTGRPCSGWCRRPLRCGRASCPGPARWRSRRSAAAAGHGYT
ncbi:hypothetical protein GCM10029963_16930 [Micromonospora andamanensis]